MMKIDIAMKPNAINTIEKTVYYYKLKIKFGIWNINFLDNIIYYYLYSYTHLFIIVIRI